MSRTDEDNERIVKDGFKGKVRRTFGRVPFVAKAVAAYYCATDPATPRSAKLAIMAALAYFVIPTDVIPDFIALLGFTDDATVFWAAWRAVRGHITDAHHARARQYLRSETAPAKTDDGEEKS